MAQNAMFEDQDGNEITELTQDFNDAFESAWKDLLNESEDSISMFDQKELARAMFRAGFASRLASDVTYGLLA